MFGRPKRRDASKPELTLEATYGLPVLERARFGTAGWRGIGYGATANEQIGAYDGTPLTQWPSRVNSPQLHQGVESLSDHWYTPSQSAALNEQQTQRPGNAMPAMRWGQPYSGPIGPLSVQAQKQAVAAAQVRQSGLSALSWAQSLSPYTAGSQ